VATILLCGVDLFFRAKLEGLLPEHRFVTADARSERSGSGTRRSGG
jgi:hypothetical protein